VPGRRPQLLLLLLLLLLRGALQAAHAGVHCRGDDAPALVAQVAGAEA
jgi:hypothetical protein